MEILNFIFRLGVVFAIYGFLWGLIDIGLRLLTSGRQRTIGEVYGIKAIQYFFLVDVTFLFCLDENNSKLIVVNQVILAGIVLLAYFMGKLQQSQNRTMLFQMIGRGLPKNPPKPVFSFRAEIIVITLSLAIFATFWFFPEYASNAASRWFHESIINIEDTPVFGFIFKVIGFFFLLNMIFKTINSFTFLLSGGKSQQRPPQNPFDQFKKDKKNDDDDYVDYEEVD